MTMEVVKIYNSSKIFVLVSFSFECRKELSSDIVHIIFGHLFIFVAVFDLEGQWQHELEII